MHTCIQAAPGNQAVLPAGSKTGPKTPLKTTRKKKERNNRELWFIPQFQVI